jgi:hypothetical protein
VSGIVGNLTVDSGFSQSEMLTLARRYRNTNPASLPTATLPTTPTVIGGADVLLLQRQPAQQVIDLWEGLPLPADPTSSTTPATSGGTGSTATSTTATAPTLPLASAPGNSSTASAFPGPHGQDPPPPGSGC